MIVMGCDEDNLPLRVRVEAVGDEYRVGGRLRNRSPATTDC
jgi:hypothetical protein